MLWILQAVVGGWTISSADQKLLNIIVGRAFEADLDSSNELIVLCFFEHMNLG